MTWSVRACDVTDRPRLLAVVPVRMTATRLPGKPLLRLDGRTIVQRVHDAVIASEVFDEVVVATDDDEIAAEVRGFGGAVQMTSASHATGTDRVAESAEGRAADVVANVQGDQPFVTTTMLQALVAPYLAGAHPDMTTLGCPLSQAGQLDDPSVVKVVRSQTGKALYFSRSPIPYGGRHDPALVLHHIGLYAFRAEFLAAYARLTPTPLEQTEKLEQLRVLEHGAEVLVGEVERPTLEINTEDDYDAAVRLVAAGGAPWQA
jgi:3-deoxy-manno-octulosonate cytidylyltransferase (CMP-KDO synthetase)